MGLEELANPTWLMTSMVEISSAFFFFLSPYLVLLLFDFSFGGKALHGATYYQ